MEKLLEKSYKAMFPFRLACPSFIYPADIVPNVEKLGAYLDEIEIIAFESKKESLPSRGAIARLLELKQEHGLEYNIHLPIDISISSTQESKRIESAGIHAEIIDLFAPLHPTTHTLHVPFDGAKDKAGNAEFDEEWKERALEGLYLVREQVAEPSAVSVETLDYPFEWIVEEVVDAGFSICLDMGHMVCFGFDFENFFIRHREAVTIIHLHGVNQGRGQNKDHVALSVMPQEFRSRIAKLLMNFNGSLSLEVFSFENLIESLVVLEKTFL